MDLLLIFSFSFFAIISACNACIPSPSPPPAVPFLSIPLYHKRMLNTFLEESFHPNRDASASIFPDEDAYGVFLWLGTPVQVLLVMVDTASHFTWSQCRPCNSGCYPQSRPLFDPSNSITFKELACDSDTCRIPEMNKIFTNCTKGLCRYGIKYAVQSYSFGRVVSETLNSVNSNSEISDFLMGCGDFHEGPYWTHFSGVLGLGRGPLSVQSQLNAKAFSLCLVGPQSETPSTLNFYESPPSLGDHYENGSITVPLSQRDAYHEHYFVQFVGIGIDGFMLDIPSRVWGYGLNYNGGVIVDTGSSLMQLPSEAYRVFSSEIRRATRNLTLEAGPMGLEFCYSDDPENVYPSIELYFENGSTEGEKFVMLRLRQEQIVLRLLDEGKVCLAFGEDKGSAVTIIGNTQLKGTLLTYDLANNLILFSPGSC